MISLKKLLKSLLFSLGLHICVCTVAAFVVVRFLFVKCAPVFLFFFLFIPNNSRLSLSSDNGLDEVSVAII